MLVVGTSDILIVYITAKRLAYIVLKKNKGKREETL